MAQVLKSIGLLGVLLATVAVATGAWASRGPAGPLAYAASFTAAGLIWTAGSIALLMTGLPRTAAGRTNGAMLAILIRTLAPLAVLVAFTRSDSPLAAAGIAGMILVHYFVGLVAETLLTVRLIRAAAPNCPDSSVAATAAKSPA
ncbi:MAG: hypothetical protein KDA44_01900 [Planctomycetales bacterium]|nr:hypothetical protein [Planctomycetales bacterium]